jgi:hypothetical protein
MRKITLVLTAAIGLTTLSFNANAQLFKKLKEKVVNAGANKASKTSNDAGSQSGSNADQNKVESKLTDFQRKNLNRIIFLNVDKVDTEWYGETEADNVTEIELGQPLIMRYYIDNGKWDYTKNQYLDVRYTVDGISFTGREFVKYAYDIVEKAPSQNAFGHFVKFETAVNLEATMMQKNTELVNANLVSPRGAYIPYLMRAEDAFRFFLATKLKSKLKPGAVLNLKAEVYRTSEATYSPSKASTIGEVYASGEIKLKVTNLYKQPNSLFNRFFSEGMVSQTHSDGAAKTIAAKFPTTVKKVHKVFFMDEDFKAIHHSVTGAILNGEIMAWVLFETQDGVLFNTKTKLTFPYNGSGFGTAPTLMESGIEEATFPVLVNPFAK